jgi:hypothetical protein
MGLSLAVVAALAGCGGSKLSHQSIEKLIVQELGNRGYAGATVKCPDVDNKVGKKFTCTVSGVSKFTTIDGSVASGDKINLDGIH